MRSNRTRSPCSSFSFTENAIHASTETDIRALLGKIDATQVNWINVNGLHDTAVIESLGSHFTIDPLVLEDILHTEHMPKLEEHDKYLFLTLKILTYCEERNTIEQEHISMVLGDCYLITFQEKNSGVFDVIRDRLNFGTARLRKRGVDYLFTGCWTQPSTTTASFLIRLKIKLRYGRGTAG